MAMQSAGTVAPADSQPLRVCQSGCFLESGSLLPPPAALRLFPLAGTATQNQDSADPDRRRCNPQALPKSSSAFSKHPPQEFRLRRVFAVGRNARSSGVLVMQSHVPSSVYQSVLPPHFSLTAPPPAKAQRRGYAGPPCPVLARRQASMRRRWPRSGSARRKTRGTAVRSAARASDAG